MATNVVYNGIELHNVVTRQWDEEVVYDSSGSDPIYHRFRLAFEGIIDATSDRVRKLSPWIDETGGGPSQTDTVDLERHIRVLLKEPRKRLIVTLYEPATATEVERSHTLLIADPAHYAGQGRSFTDVASGPKPQVVSIIQIIADKLFRVRFAIDCCLVECAAHSMVPYVLNNRWTVSENYDDDWYATRLIRGRLRVSDALASLHDLHPFVLPLLEPGFRRSHVSFVESADQLEVEYEITDTQTHTSAPWPASRISGSYSQSTGDGTTYLSQCTVRLEGPPHAAKRDLIAQVTRILDAKLRITTTTFGKSYIPVNFSITEYIGDRNVVEGSGQIQHQMDSAAGAIGEYLTNLQKRMGEEPLKLQSFKGHAYDPRFSEMPAPWGYNSQGGVRSGAALFLLHCALQTPCNASITKTYPGAIVYVSPGVGEPETEPTTIEGGTYPGELPASTSPNYYDPETAKEGLYTHYTIRSEYAHERCRVQLPLADPDIDETKDDTCVVATLSSGQTQREIWVEGARSETWPQLPEPVDSYTDGTLKGTLLSNSIAFHPPQPSADFRKRIYRVEGHYIYALNRPPRKDESHRIGRIPFSNVDDADTKVTPAILYAEVLSP